MTSQDFGDSYAAACAAATTYQGLDPVVSALTDAGLPVEVEQTGGFTMVAVVRGTDVVVGITAESRIPDGFTVCQYRGTDWDDGEGEEADYVDVPDVDAMVDQVRAYLS